MPSPRVDRIEVAAGSQVSKGGNQRESERRKGPFYPLVFHKGPVIRSQHIVHAHAGRRMKLKTSSSKREKWPIDVVCRRRPGVINGFSIVTYFRPAKSVIKCYRLTSRGGHSAWPRVINRTMQPVYGRITVSQGRRMYFAM